MGMLGVKTVLMFSSVVCVALMLKLSLPVILDFLIDDLPLIWSHWVRPPYLYLFVNCIILSIVASNKLQPRGSASDQPKEQPISSIPPLSSEEKLSEEGVKKSDVLEAEDVPVEDTAAATMEKEVVFGYVESEEVKDEEDPTAAAVEKEERVVEGPTEMEEKGNIIPVENTVVHLAEKKEKPCVSARFGSRRAVKGSPEGKAVLGVSRPKRQETLESTWRTITEGKPMPLKRHLKKSDTFGAGQDTGSSPPVRMMKKSDTFSSSRNVSASPGSGGKLRREPSLSQDELNRRVEAFIKKFNEDMRMQRQESLNQYQQQVMVGGGVH